MQEVTKTVLEFIDVAARLHGKKAEQDFNVDMFRSCVDGEMRSPIEQLFYVALNCFCSAWDMPINPDPEYHEATGGWRHGRGLHVSTQQKIGKYRVDFCLRPVLLSTNEFTKGLVVELDGHKFHDRDAKQRSYEKARDRFLLSQGLLVAHFTGSDVVADPFKCVFEALQMLRLTDGIADEYQPADPLSMGG